MKVAILLTLFLLLFVTGAFAQSPVPLFPVSVNGKLGLVDREGKTVVEPRYEKIREFSEGLAAVRLDGRWGYIDQTGKIVITPVYRVEPGAFGSGLAPVPVAKGMWAYIDTAGETRTGQLYDTARPFVEGLAAVQIGSEWGYLTPGDKTSIIAKCSKASDFSDGLAFVEIGGQWRLIDKTGTEVSQNRFTFYGLFSEGLAAVKVKNLWGYIDDTGEFVVKPVYEEAASFSEGLAAVFKDCRYGYIDKTGKMTIEPQFTYAAEFSGGLAAVAYKKNNYVSKDPDGQRICIRPKFVGSIGYIDRAGKIVIREQFGSAGNFTNGLARVEYQTPGSSSVALPEWGYIDQAGKFIWQPDAWKPEP